MLKERALETKRIVRGELHAAGHAAASVIARVIRAKRWYRRSPRTLYEDVTYPLRARVLQLRTRREMARRKRATVKPISRIASDEVFFDDPEWQDVPALDLLARHLNSFETVVHEAESAFIVPNASVPGG